MVLLVQTREPRIQTFNLTNSIYQGFVSIVSLVIFVCFDGQEDNKVKLWSDFTSVLTAFWSEAQLCKSTLAALLVLVVAFSTKQQA